MKRVIFRVGLAIPSIVAAGWFAHGPGSETTEPREMQATSARRTSPTSSPAGGFAAGFHAVTSDRDGVRRDAGLAEIAGRWIDRNPHEALDFARRLPTGEIRATFLRQLLVAWAGKDAASALSWSDQLKDESEHRHARSTICIELAKKDPRRALELAIGHGADEASDGLLENLTMQWADRETTATMEWVRSQPSAEWKERLVARVAYVLAKTDPCAAACRVAEDMTPGAEQNEAVISVVHQWALLDPEAAARWVGELPPGALQERAKNELAGIRAIANAQLGVETGL